MSDRTLSRNVIGPVVAKLRNQKGWTQETMVAKCNVAGFDITRTTLSQIEARTRTVTDLEFLWLAKVLKVEPRALAPEKLPEWKKRRSPKLRS